MLVRNPLKARQVPSERRTARLAVSAHSPPEVAEAIEGERQSEMGAA
jgi:hypothetical protein